MSRAADAMLVQHNLKALNLTNMARHIEQHLRQARDEGIDYSQFLLELTELELRIRTEQREKRRLKEAKFPLLKPLESFEFEAAPSLDRRLVRELATGDYIDNQRNVILLGKSGTGKTHLAPRTDLFVLVVIIFFALMADGKDGHGFFILDFKENDIPTDTKRNYHFPQKEGWGTSSP